MIVLLSCNNEDDQIKNKGTRMATRLYNVFFIYSRADNSVVNGGI